MGSRRRRITVGAIQPRQRRQLVKSPILGSPGVRCTERFGDSVRDIAAWSSSYNNAHLLTNSVESENASKTARNDLIRHIGNSDTQRQLFLNEPITNLRPFQ